MSDIVDQIDALVDEQLANYGNRSNSSNYVASLVKSDVAARCANTLRPLTNQLGSSERRLPVHVTQEAWRAIPGLRYYEVSNQGEVRSLPREVRCSDGRSRKIAGGILKSSPNVASGYPQVRIYRKTRNVHQLVALAFLGPAQHGYAVRHLDGNPKNLNIANLCYGTVSENNLDIVRHGRHIHARKTHCKWGHELSSGNVYLRKGGRHRVCIKCSKRNHRKWAEKQK